MKQKMPFLIVLLIFFIGNIQLDAQTRLMNKIKDKAEDKVIEKLFGEDEKKEQQQSSSQDQPGYYSNESSSSSGNQNTKGGGISNIDIGASIDGASSKYRKEDYTGSRSAIKQAIQGIEIEMGKDVLKSLPNEVDGLKADEKSDKVTSSGAGFVGLYIERRYEKGDRELHFVVANNSMWISAINMHLGATAYNSSGEEQYKQIQFQGNQGVIEYDESSGYKMSVPFGQSSILVLEGVNFETEKQFMSACDNFKINTIKEKLGEK